MKKQPNPTPVKICRMCLALHHKPLQVTFLEGLCLKVKKVSSEGSHFFPVTKSESEWDNQLPSLHLAGLAEEGRSGKPNGLCYYTRTTDTQWRHKSKISEKLCRSGRQNMLRPYLKIWEWEWIFGRAVKVVSCLGVRSPCLDEWLKGYSYCNTKCC